MVNLSKANPTPTEVLFSPKARRAKRQAIAHVKRKGILALNGSRHAQPSWVWVLEHGFVNDWTGSSAPAIFTHLGFVAAAGEERRE